MIANVLGAIGIVAIIAVTVWCRHWFSTRRGPYDF
jgi:uncharacterized membrane protein